MKLGKKKDLSDLTVFKSLFVRGKWLVIFVISNFFLPTNIFKRLETMTDCYLNAAPPLLSSSSPFLESLGFKAPPPPLNFRSPLDTEAIGPSLIYLVGPLAISDSCINVSVRLLTLVLL